MEQQPHTDAPVTDAVEAIIAQGRAVRTIGNLVSWHDRAQHSHDQLSATVLMTRGSALLNEMPYDDIESYIREAKCEVPDALLSMRRARRLFMVARDAIILGADHTPSSALDPLFELCRSLGRVADTSGQDRKALKSSLRSLADVSELTVDVDDVASAGLLSSRVDRYLHTRELTSHAMVMKADHGQYHSWRKGFRRVVNVYTVHASDTGSPDDVSFAIRGVALNNHYGHINESIKSGKGKA